MKKYKSTDIAIVGIGALLPEANNTQEFLDNVAKSKNSIKPISEYRWIKDLNFSPYKEDEDKSCSHYGAEISFDVYDQLNEKYGLEYGRNSRLQVMTMEATAQAIENLNLPSDRKKVSLILGLMNPDEFYYSNISFQKKDRAYGRIHDLLGEDKKEKAESIFKFYEDKYFHQFETNVDFTLSTSALKYTKDRFDIQGASYLVDAACASSLASIDISMKKLKMGEVDIALCGGIESNLSPGSYVLFSKVGALAPEKCLPFDACSEGLSQGEGAVVFALERVEDAIKNGHKIEAIVRSSEGSSDGKSASLFQPTPNGQLLAYSRAYKNIKRKSVDYIEAHGTGTQMGDMTELQSLSLFFKDYKIPIGSVKSQIGHAKATAGSASLIKCIGVMQNKNVPPSPYFEKFGLDLKTELFVNTKPFPLQSSEEPLRCGISSFGFGGCNFHAVIEEYKQKSEVEPAKLWSEGPRKVFCVGESYIPIENFNEADYTSKESFYRIPPKSIPQIDKIQLLAVSAVKQAFENNNIAFEFLNKDDVQVFSTSAVGLDILENMAMRVTFDTIAESILIEGAKGEVDKEVSVEVAKCLKDFKDDYDPITEDSGPGILNNVIAGRVCNAFNFKGKAYNIDCDVASVGAGFDAIYTELQEPDEEKLTVLITVDEVLDESTVKVDRKGVGVFLFCHEEYAQKNMLRPLSELKGANV